MSYFFENDVRNNGARELFSLAQNVREDKKNQMYLGIETIQSLKESDKI